MEKPIEIDIRSEVGELEAVIIHSPGQEVENMTPQNAERALYSDILNLSVVSREFKNFKWVLNQLTRTFELKDLLKDVLSDKEVKQNLLEKIFLNEGSSCARGYLISLTPEKLASLLIEGVPLVEDNLTNFLSQERFSLQPLHNFFFTRDAAIAIRNKILIAKMSNRVREREAIILETIFTYHHLFKTTTTNPMKGANFEKKITIEGGDILVVRDDILLIGIGARTTTQGVDFILDVLKEKKEKRHLIIQELPLSPESFIHLDMVFTFLDRDFCLIYEPVVMDPNKFRTVCITLDNGHVRINEEKNIPETLKKLGMDLKALKCGGNKDSWIQEREQWHSGANFFAVAPGKIIGYGRNIYTLEELNKNGFEIFKADDLKKQKIDLESISRYAITINGAELARGGGGCRCMTLPLRRKVVH